MDIESEKPTNKDKERNDQKNGMYKRVCSWCNKDMGIKGKGEYKGITHGVCPECEEKLVKELDELNSKNDQ